MKGERMKTVLLLATLLFGIISKGVFASDKPAPRAPPVSIPEIVGVAKPAIVKIITLDAEGHAIKGGTGFFISADGLVATNYHVIEGAKQIQIVCQGLDGADYHIEYISLTDGPGGAVYPAADLAILKVTAQSHSYLPLGSSADAREGQHVLVIGNPEGLSGTVSDGLIAAFRYREPIWPTYGGNLIQITAPLSPGSSGSPVLDEDGRVIGVAKMILKEGQNLNFAIPVERLRAEAQIAITIPPQERDKIVRLVATYLESFYSENGQAQLRQFPNYTEPPPLDHYCTPKALEVARRIATRARLWPKRSISFDVGQCQIFKGNSPDQYKVEQTFGWSLTNGKKHKECNDCGVFLGTVIKDAEANYRFESISGFEGRWLDLQ
jgi:hypothetical protein